MSSATRPAALRPVATAPTDEGGLTVSLRRTMEWSASELAALDALVDARPHVGIFLTRAWLSGLLEAPPPGVDASILVFHQHGALRGLIPLAVADSWAGVQVTLLGGGFRSDCVDLLAERGFEFRLAERFLEWLRELGGRRGFVLKLRDVPGDSPLWGAIRRAVDERRAPWVLVPHEVHALPYLPLHERDAHGDEDRTATAASLRRHWASLGRRGPLKVDLLDDVQGVMRGLDVLTLLLRARWGSDVSVLDDARAAAFHRSVLPRLVAEGRARMLLMRVDLRPVGVCYALTAGAGVGERGRAWWGYYIAGYDRQWAGRIHLGRLVVDRTMDLASGDGAQQFDFLKGAERYKYFWPVRERVTVDGNLYAGAFAPQAMRASLAARQAAASLVKAVRSVWS